MLSSRTHPHKPSDRAFSRVRRMLLALAAVAAVLAGPAAGIAAATKPVNNLAPEIVGRALIGERLGCGAGSWTGGELSFAFRWIRAGIPVREGVSYTLSAADEHKQVWCVVTATRGGESTEVESSNSYELGGPGKELPHEAPLVVTPPQVSGEPKVGATLSCSQGTWKNEPTGFEYKWLRTRSGEAAETIKAAASSTYVLAGEDQGDAVSCKVTASNSAGSSTPAASSNSVMVKGEAPNVNKPPEVTGTREVGRTLTCFNPESNWGGSRPLTFKYAWRRSGAVISSAATYTVQPSDEGRSLLCEVTASNSEGSATAESASVTIQPPLPENLKQPTISVNGGGEPQPGKKLTCSPGTWTGSPTFEYEWRRGSERVPNQEKENYTVVSEDEGHTLACVVTARNSRGATSRSSEPVVVAEQGHGKPEEQPPEKSSPVVVVGTPEYGHELICTSSWQNAEEVIYQWVRDKGQSGEVSLELGTSSRYVVVHEDEGHALTCKATAVNRFGKTGPIESSAQHVKGGKPVFIGTVLEVAGNARVGETLTCPHEEREWSAAPRPTYTFAWQRNGAAITGASGSAYTIVSADRGTALTCVVTATNRDSEGNEGKGTKESVALHVPGNPPEGEAAIEVEGGGEVAVGVTLKCLNNGWTGAPTPTFSYQWLLNGVADPGETARTFTVGPGDRGLLISCSVTGSSSEGSSTATSRSLHVPGIRPQQVVSPQISGSAALGATLTCNRGIWKGAPPPTFSYQWVRDGVAIASATASTYIVEPADQGHLLSCDVVAANTEGRVEVESSNAVAIPARVSTSGGVGGFKATGSAIFQPSAAVVLADLSRELISAERGLSLKSVLKHGGFTFSFTAPTAGTLELFWYAPVKLAHGSSKKAKPLLVGRTSMVFTAAVKHTVHLKLTTKGRQALKGKKRVKLAVKGVFTVAHGKPVTWTSTLVLSR
jgi:hypothetical protein